MKFTQDQVDNAATYARAGASDAAIAGMLAIDEIEFEEALRQVRDHENDDAGPMLAAITQARHESRLAAEIELRQRNPSAWLKQQREAGGSRFRRILGLPRFQEVHERLASGETPEYVARVIHEEMRVLTDLKRTSLVTLLRQYRAEAIGIPVDPDDPAAEQRRQALEAQLSEKVDVAEELMWLVQVQKKRVRMFFEKEVDRSLGPGKANPLEDFGWRDVSVLAETLERLGDFQVKTGLVRRAPIAVEGRITTSPDLPGAAPAPAAAVDRMTNDARVLEDMRAATNQFLLSLRQHVQGNPGEQSMPPDEPTDVTEDPVIAATAATAAEPAPMGAP